MTAPAELVREPALPTFAPTAPAPRSPRAGIAYYLAFAGLVVNILDAWFYPAAGLNTGGIKYHGLRVTDELTGLSLLVSLIVLLSGRLRIPRVLGIPLGLATLAWTLGLMVGLQLHHPTKYILAECHVMIYVYAFCLAWLQAPEPLTRKHESYLLPITFLAAAYILPSSATEKGGDISTIAAGIAAIALVRHKAWASIPITVLAGSLVLTGGQRSALLFSYPPALFAALIAASRRPWRQTTAFFFAVGTGAVAIALAVYSNAVAAFIDKVRLRTFDRVGKAESTNSRKEQWAIAEHQIHTAPVFGKGLGFRYKLYDPQLKVSALTDITHNIYLDVTMRMGFVGAGLLGAILVLALIKVWTSRRDLTAFRVTVMLILLGFLIHGGAESILDKPRLALFMAWLVALLLTSPGREAEAQAATP